VSYGSPEEEWQALLTGSHLGVLKLKQTFRRVPSPPRCKLCHAPFEGVGGFVLKPWFGRWERNSQLCKNCMSSLMKRGIGGAEIELSLLFADVRGSTGLGERMRPAEFTALLETFYRVAVGAILGQDGIVDKFVGDEVIGLFVPGFAGRDHARKAIAAGTRTLRELGAIDGRPIPVGAGIHTGVAFVGTVGSDERISDFTAIGDAVNTTARLASLAAAGELLVSRATADAAELDEAGAETRTVEVRGREATLDVVVLRPGVPTPA